VRLIIAMKGAGAVEVVVFDLKRFTQICIEAYLPAVASKLCLDDRA
jgi:hypothetical protein